jgi:prophage tail gpP-like protein
MPVPYSPNTPDLEEVQLRIMDEQVTLTRWTRYEFASDYLKPASAFHFTLGDGDLDARERGALKAGARVRLTVNGAVLADGHIDTIEINAGVGSGTQYSISGRERIGLAVDAVADPTLLIKESFTLGESLRLIYGPLGWIADEHFAIDTAASRGVTQGLRGTPMTKGKKRQGIRPLKSYIQHQCKPYNHEGLHDFAKRITERHGLWIRCSEDGERIIVDRPNFVQDVSFQVRRSHDGGTNVLDGTVRFDFSQQPSCIIADGFSGGGEFGKGKIKAYGVNPYFGVDEQGFVLDEIVAVLQKHPTAAQVTFVTQPFPRRSLNVPPRIIYLHDEESKTQEQLNNFVRREMSLFMRKSLTAHYVVEGHGQMVNDQFVPWLVDSVVDVQDEIGGLTERMWVSSVAYSKSRQSGTTTSIELLRLNSLQLGEQSDVAGASTSATTVTKKAPLNLSSSGFVKTNPQPGTHRAASTVATRK